MDLIAPSPDKLPKLALPFVVDVAHIARICAYMNSASRDRDLRVEDRSLKLGKLSVWLRSRYG